MMGGGMAGGMGGDMAGGMASAESEKTRAYYPAIPNMRYNEEQPLALKRFREESERHTPPMAHGGSVTVNDEAYDAMFFKNYGVNPFIDTEDDHLSTFATDVDTGSYSIAREYLRGGDLPPSESVRVEEFVNYFKYRYAAPQEDDFAIYAEGTPWSFGTGRKNSHLLRIGLKGRKISEANRKPAILTFVIDVSGSMDQEHRLGLVKMSLEALIDRLRPEDKIGIATYNTRGRKFMSHKSLHDRHEIIEAIYSLNAGGSTNADEGIRIGYDMAERAYRKGYINRVILCSDGVANEGLTSAEEIFETIERQVDKGITLSALGFGMGNYNDVLLEQLGDKGNGYYAYIDYLDEAIRLFDDNLTGALEVIARDVKVQVDFNPSVVRSYRLIGYENRDVPDDKFRDDKYDGGEVGAGHSVTALYELKLWPDKKGTAATAYVRYKDADTRSVTEFRSKIDVRDFAESFEDGNTDFRLAATAAEFAEILRKSYWAKGAELADTLDKAMVIKKERSKDEDVAELVELISRANRLMETETREHEEAEEETCEKTSEEESENIIYIER
jgi:Ca-activated chloride channel family protein